MADSTKRCPFCDEVISAKAIKCKHCSSMLNEPPTDPQGTLDVPGARAVGSTLSGRYRITRELGRGGMGVVCLAHDEELGTDVAIKFLPRELAGDIHALEQLRSEARLSMSLTHPNIMRLHNLDSSGQVKFLVMEYVDGPNLLDKLREKGRLSPKDAFPLIKGICEGMEYAHSRRILHRDLKPANVMLTSKGEVKITDFGIARRMRESMSRLSQKTISGTPAYMAPEHIMGENLTVRSDVYSLGAVVYELLAGHPPFHQGDILAQIRFKEPPPIPGLPDPVNRAIRMALAKNADDRPSSAMAFFNTFDRALEGEQVGPTIRAQAPPAAASEEYVLTTGTAKKPQQQDSPSPQVTTGTYRRPKRHIAATIVVVLATCLALVLVLFDPFEFISDKEKTPVPITDNGTDSQQDAPDAQLDEVEKLILKLNDENVQVRCEAAQALGDKKDPRAVEPLTGLLEDEAIYGDPKVMTTSVGEAAAQALGRIGDKKAVPPLSKALKSSSEDIRREAARALGEIGDSEAVPALIEALKVEDDSVCMHAATALGKIGDARAVEKLIEIMNEVAPNAGYHYIFREAVEALTEIGDKRALLPIAKHLDNKDEMMRGNAAWALAEIGDESIEQQMTDALESDYWNVRRAAVNALARIKGKDAILILTDKLWDERPEVRRDAAIVLGKIGDERVLENLIFILNDDEDEEVRKYTLESLKKITGQDFGMDGDKWLNWYYENYDDR